MVESHKGAWGGDTLGVRFSLGVAPRNNPEEVRPFHNYLFTKMHTGALGAGRTLVKRNGI